MRLNVYHLDHNPRNDNLSNLVLLCPLCAQDYDAEEQRRNEARQRKSEKAQLSFNFQTF